MKCKECGYDYIGSPKFCPECGKPTISDSIVCRKCSREIAGNLKYCPECGEPTNNDYKRKKGRNKDDEDDDDEGGILGGIGDIVGKLFGG